MPTGEQIIKSHVLNECREDGDNDWGYAWPESITPGNADEIWADVEDSTKYGQDWLRESLYEVRGCGEPSNAGPEIDFRMTRHYEVERVAFKFGGVWVGWLYWHGGGKHGNEEEIDWVQDAVILGLVGETRVVTIKRTFELQGTSTAGLGATTPPDTV